MPNIFDGIRKMPDDEIRLEIALLTQTNLLNAAKETGNKLVNGIADFANSLFKSFGSFSTLDYRAVKLPDMIDEQAKKLSTSSRTELMSSLKKLVAARCGVPDEEQDTVGEDRLSFLAVGEAAKLYNITKYATPANKIEQVRIHYNKTFLMSLHQCIIKQNEEEQRDFDRKLQKRIDEISIEDKRELHKILLPKEFSGRGIARILRLERGTKYLEQTVLILGIHTFDETAVHAAAAVSAVKSMKSMSRALLAQLVWRAAGSWGGSFKVNVSSLPSYDMVGGTEEQKRENEELRSLLERKNNLLTRLTEGEKQLDRVDAQVGKTGERLHSERESLAKARETFERLASQKSEYTGGLHTDSETKSYYSRVNDASRRLEQLENSAAALEEKLAELDRQSAECEENLKTERLQLEKISAEADDKLGKLSEKLMNKWKAYFFRFSFDSEVFGQAVAELDLPERLAVEEMLKELHDCYDTEAFDAAPMSGEIICSVSDRRNAVIIHEGRNIKKIKKQG